jgi:hypothetical protein
MGLPVVAKWPTMRLWMTGGRAKRIVKAMHPHQENKPPQASSPRPFAKEATRRGNGPPACLLATEWSGTSLKATQKQTPACRGEGSAAGLELRVRVVLAALLAMLGTSRTGSPVRVSKAETRFNIPDA